MRRTAALLCWPVETGWSSYVTGNSGAPTAADNDEDLSAFLVLLCLELIKK